MQLGHQDVPDPPVDLEIKEVNKSDSRDPCRDARADFSVARLVATVAEGKRIEVGIRTQARLGIKSAQFTLHKARNDGRPTKSIQSTSRGRLEMEEETTGNEALPWVASEQLHHKVRVT